MKFGLCNSGWAGVAERLVLAVAMAPGAPSTASQVVVLPSSAAVSGETIKLSDLLPPGAGGKLRQRCEAVDLARAPLPGSVRVLDATRISSILQQQPALRRQLAIPDQVVVSRAGWGISRAAIRDALNRFYRNRVPDQAMPDPGLQWGAEITTRERDPRLEVTGLGRDVRGQGWQLRLRCAQRAQCGSFVVRAVDPQGWSGSGGPSRNADRSFQTALHPVPSATAAGPVLVEAGKKAMLWLSDGSMSITLPVICLERGRLTQKIRVLDAASHRVLQADVMGAGKLRASF